MDNIFTKSVIKNENKFENKCEIKDENLIKIHSDMAKKYRNSNLYTNLYKNSNFKIQNLNKFYTTDFHPILFIDSYINNISKSDNEISTFLRSDVSHISEIDINNQYNIPNINAKLSNISRYPSKILDNPLTANNKINLIFLLHGLNGSHFDMKLYLNHLTLHFPHNHYKISEINEADTMQSIEKLGENFAFEVSYYIKKTFVSDNIISTISFIGHSLGGLIIRSALPLLEKYRSKFNFYMTLSTPHLGFKNSNSKLVSTGFNLIRKFNKKDVFEELALEDNKEIKNSFIYKLSKYDGLQWFNNIILICSPQDNYCPHFSGRIEMKETLSTYYKEMITNIFSKNIKADIYRCDVDITSNSKSIDWMIGRAPHIQLIDNSKIIELIIFEFTFIFK